MMQSFGTGVGMDIENDTEGELVMRLSSLYRTCLNSPAAVDESWFKCDIHKDLVAVCNKFDDKAWFRRSQNCYCIYYACAILCYMAGHSEYGALRIANEPKIISTLLLIWQGNHLTWIESRCAIKTIHALMRSAPQLLTNFLHNDVGVDFVKLAIAQYGQCLFDTIKKCAVVPNQIKPGYVQDLMGIIKGKSMNYDTQCLRDMGIDLGQEWVTINGTVLSFVGQSLVKAEKTGKNKAQNQANKKKFLDSFVNNVDLELIEKACSLDLCWTMIYNDPTKYRGRDYFVDCVIYLSHFEEFSRKFGQCNCVIEWLIVRLRSVNTLNARFDLIINNLLRFDSIDKKYYPDLANTLVPLLEVGATMENIQLRAGLSDFLTIFNSVVSSLKMIFNMAPDFEFVSVENIKKYQCRACKNIVKYPYKMKFCKHNYCKLCIFFKLNEDPDSRMRRCLVKNCNSDEFDWFGWTSKRPNHSLANAVKLLQIKTSMPGNGNEEFVGTQLEFWEHVKQMKDVINAEKFLSDKKFDYFVDYMAKEASVMQISDLKEMRQQAKSKKVEGNEHFKQNEWESAIKCYKQALHLCPKQYGVDRVLYFSNLALTYIKTGDYLNAYYACLSGLAFGAKYLKLGYSLVQCYDNLKFDEIFVNISDKEPLVSYYEDCAAVTLQKMNMVDRAHSLAKVSILQPFSTDYSWPKIAQKLGLENCRRQPTQEEENAIRDEIRVINETDPIAKLTASLLQNASSDTHFIIFHLIQFCKKYRQFLQRYETSKRQIYRFMFDSLASRVEQEQEGAAEAAKKAEIRIDEMFEMVKACFATNDALLVFRSDLNKQNLLIQGLYNISFDMHAVQTLPTDLSGIIGGYLFSQSSYDFQAMEKWAISRITKAANSKLERKWGSKDCLKFQDGEDSLYNNWKDIEFDNDDSCGGEFLKLI